jgi:DNA-binding MarR family transcriptional regulator
MTLHSERVDQILSALRRVIRAVDLHSRQLVQSHGLTGPQALVLKAVRHERLSAGTLAERVSLSQGTVTDILNRLEQRGLVTRLRSDTDRRRVMVELSPAGRDCLASSPPLLQDRFASRFEELEQWEQTQLLASLQRIAAMMDAGDIDAAPVLSSGSVRATPEAVENMVEPADDSDFADEDPDQVTGQGR